MTIDELFDMPICEMKQWMADNFKKSTPKKVGSYRFFNIEDSFGLEIPEDSNWRIIPVMSDFGEPARGLTFLDHMMSTCSDDYRFGVAKVSKHGECLIYVFQGSFVENRNHATSKYGLYNVHFELDKILCNGDRDNEPIRCYVDGPDVVNSSKLAVYYRETDPEFKRKDDNWLKDFEMIDDHFSIKYKMMPKIGAVNKNKHTLNEFNSGLEAFAKKCSTIGKKAYEENKHVVEDKEFIEKCKTVHIDDPQDVFELWTELYVHNQDVTFDNVIGMIKLSESNEKLVIEYREKNKCGEVKKDWYNKWRIKEHTYRSPYYLSTLFGWIDYVAVDKFYGYLNDLAETWRLYTCLENYKHTIRVAKEDYRDTFSAIAEEWEEEIRKIYASTAEKLNKAKSNYLSSAKTLYEHIHSTYPDVNDSDVGIFADIPDITDKIEKSFEEASTKLMKLVIPNYKPEVDFTPKDVDEEGFSEAFKNHCKIMFDAVPECDKIPYYKAGKCYDAPYETWEWDNYDIAESFNEEHIFQFEEVHGQGSFDEWCSKYEKLVPYSMAWENDANELYPGQRIIYYITRDFKHYEEEDD